MRLALRLAARHQGQTMPNPSVGCVLVKNNQLIAATVTAIGGRPHAEALAIEQAGAASGCTAYVTLEPCAHQGKTPPCARSLIDAGIKRVVIGIRDPDPRVNGQGIEMLKQAGVEVTENCLQHLASEQLAGFFTRIQQKRPRFTLKIATSADNYMARKTGDRWITCELSRRLVHLLRARNEAIITGIGTILADDPRLDCRLPGLEDASPIRIVCDRHLRIPQTAAILDQDLPGRTIIATTEHATVNKTAWQKEYKTLPLPEDFLQNLAIELASLGISTALIEAGPRLSEAFLAAGLVDEIHWFESNYTLNSNGNSPFHPAMDGWSPASQKMIGKDRLTIYRGKASV